MSYTALRNGIVSHGAQIGSFGFLPSIHTKTNVKQMCPESLHPMGHSTLVHLHAQAAVDAGAPDEPRLPCLREKNPKIPNLSLMLHPDMKVSPLFGTLGNKQSSSLCLRHDFPIVNMLFEKVY